MRPDDAWRQAIPLDQAQPAPTNPNYRAPRLPLIDFCGFEGATIPDRRWLVPRWIPWGSVALLAGDGGMGKSLLSQMLCTAAATGGQWLGMNVERAKALAIFCEDDADELHRRQVAINEAMDISFADLENFAALSGVGQDNALHVFQRDEYRWDASDFFQRIHNAASDGGFQLVVLDSLHDLFAGNENSRVEVRRFVQLLQSLALDIDGTVLLTAHPSRAGRSDGTGESGSTAWNNAVRSRLYLEAAKPEDGQSYGEVADLRRLSRKKANYAARGEAITLRWNAGAFVVEGDSEPPTWFEQKARDRQAEERFLMLLDRAGAEGRHVSHKSRAGNYAPKMFAKRRDRDGFNKDDFERAMERLFEARTIVAGTVRDSHRNSVNAIQRASSDDQKEGA